MPRPHSRYSPRTGAGWIVRQMTRPNPNVNKCKECRAAMRVYAKLGREMRGEFDRQCIEIAEAFRDRCDGHPGEEAR